MEVGVFEILSLFRKFDIQLTHDTEQVHFECDGDGAGESPDIDWG